MVVYLCWWFFLTTIADAVQPAADNSKSSSSDDNDDKFDLSYGIFDWINKASNEGGYFNPKQEFRPDTTTGFLGVFAKVDIPKGEVLCQVPYSRKIIPYPNDTDEDDEDEEDDEDDTSDCDTANQLAEYMRHPFLHPQFTPYALYTRNQRRDQLPSWWSVPGKHLLLQLLGNGNVNGNNSDELHDQLLPPAQITTILDEWYDECRSYGSFIQDEWWNHAAMLVHQRADDDIMIPGYDMYNHRNGYPQWLNTETEFDPTHLLLSPHRTVASQDIKAGDQLYNSYNMCVNCGSRKEGGYGTQEMFRDYGFIEQYPQRWKFTQLEKENNRWTYIEFDLEEEEIIQGTANTNDDDNDNDDNTNTLILVVKWIRKPSNIAVPQIIVWFTSQLQRLEQFQVHVVPTVNNNTSDAAVDVDVDVDVNTDADIDTDADAEKKEVLQQMTIPTTNELEMIEIFRQANIVAITQALQALATMTPDEYQEDDDDEDDDEDEDEDDNEDDNDDDDEDEDEDDDVDDDEDNEDEDNEDEDNEDEEEDIDEDEDNLSKGEL